MGTVAGRGRFVLATSKRRRKPSARKRYERQAAQLAAQAERRRRMRRNGWIATGGLAGLALVVALVVTRMSSAPQAELTVGPIKCSQGPSASASAMAFSGPSGAGATTGVLKTTCGDIAIEFNPDAPKAVQSFSFLARRGLLRRFSMSPTDDRRPVRAAVRRSLRVRDRDAWLHSAP